MSLNKLVGGDCGGNNSLVQLSSIVGRDAASSKPVTLSDQYVNEFMAQNSAQAPQTFNMNTLLNHIPNVSVKNVQALPGPSSSSQMNSWRPGSSAMFLPQRPMTGNLMHMQPMSQIGSQKFNQNVPIQYINESEMQDNGVKAKAMEFVNETSDDDNLQYSQFMDFMKKVSSAEMRFDSPEAEQRQKDRDDFLNVLNEKYREEWKKLSEVNDVWDSSNGISKEYEFAEDNVMLENKNALELGKEKLKMGDIPGAVVCFEAAAQQDPNSAITWYFLGSTQAENEQDPLAITALNKCVEIDPSMKEAYLILAAAFANENMPKHAYISLLDWLKNSPKYNDLATDIDTKGIELKSLQAHVINSYLVAARRSPEQIDADIQNALGVVFNISQEYDKAVDCFKTALMVQSENPRLWNRLGATLANSNRSEEAVDAYHRALYLEPGFVRARYNVGITCMNLGAYKQAAEHFLVALNQQNKADTMGSQTGSTTSPAIWTTLRMVCGYMGEHKVAKLVDQKNLTELNKFFEFDS